jgi:hypothetical protein
MRPTTSWLLLDARTPFHGGIRRPPCPPDCLGGCTARQSWPGDRGVHVNHVTFATEPGIAHEGTSGHSRRPDVERAPMPPCRLPRCPSASSPAPLEPKTHLECFVVVSYCHSKKLHEYRLRGSGGNGGNARAGGAGEPQRWSGLRSEKWDEQCRYMTPKHSLPATKAPEERLRPNQQYRS